MTPGTIHSGRFASRPIDTMTLRVGRSGAQTFRSINYMDEELRNPLRSICHIAMDDNKPEAENIKLVQGVIELLAAGQEALKAKRELAKTTSQSC